MPDFISARCRFGADPWSRKDLITFFIYSRLFASLQGGSIHGDTFFISALILNRQTRSRHTWEVQCAYFCRINSQVKSVLAK
jgi:hypothetical protein